MLLCEDIFLARSLCCLSTDSSSVTKDASLTCMGMFMSRVKESTDPRGRQPLMQAPPGSQSPLLGGVHYHVVPDRRDSRDSRGRFMWWWTFESMPLLIHPPRKLYAFKMEGRYFFSCCPVKISLETLHIVFLPHCLWESHEWCPNCVREMCTLTGIPRAEGSVARHPASHPVDAAMLASEFSSSLASSLWICARAARI